MQFKEELAMYLNKYHLKFDDSTLSKFEIFYNLLIQKNKQFNLTAITEQTDVIVKHFIDSLLVEKHIASNARLIDIGSGAGLPALPLKFIKPDLHVVAVDSVNKKVNFINEVASNLKLQNFAAIHSRTEQLAHQLEFRQQFDVATCRAVAQLNTLCEYSLPFLKVGGIMIAYKGGDIQTELKNAQTAINILGGKILNTYNFALENMQRSIIIIKKVKNSPRRYPRAGNKPRTNPLT